MSMMSNLDSRFESIKDILTEYQEKFNKTGAILLKTGIFLEEIGEKLAQDRDFHAATSVMVEALSKRIDQLENRINEIGMGVDLE